jgi:hypothetical protein
VQLADAHEQPTRVGVLRVLELDLVHLDELRPRLERS